MKPHAWIVCGAMLAGLSVAMGAIGAHLLKNALERRTDLPSQDVEKRLETYETAARYHMYHALAIVLVGLLTRQASTGAANFSGWCFLLGIVLFSGGCYGYAAGGPKMLVHIVPVGGVAFIVGWLALATAAWQGKG